jgi:hypothetical protein
LLRVSAHVCQTRAVWTRALVVPQQKGVRMPWSVGRVAAALSLLPLWLGCAGAPAAPASAVERVCSPDTGYSCTRFNCTGYQRCLSDGSGFTPCMCNDQGTDDDAGSARPKERCGNGIDDDDDGRIDCDDSDCTSMRCSPSAPRDWQGPVVLADVASCRDSFDQEAFHGGSEPSAAPASCSACSCGGASCAEFLDFVTSSGAQCGGDACTTSFNQSCGEIAPACLKDLTTAYLKTQVPGTSGCQPSEQKPTLEPAHWKKPVRACRPAAVYTGGCPTDMVCMPGTSDASAAPFCIWREGEHDCPAGKYSQRQVLQREIKDTRSCSACSCKAPGCDYRFRVFDAQDASCATPLLELKSEGQCVQVNPSTGKLRVGAAISGGGACEASGGQSSGDVSGDSAATVCCTP